MGALLASPVLAAIITGVFGIIGKTLENNQKREAVAQAGPAIIPNTLPPALQGKVIWGKVLIHIGIIQLLANVLGFVTGYAMASNGSDFNSIITVILLLGTILLIISFYIIGTNLDKTVIWKHLTYVALGVVVVTLLIDLVVQVPITGVTILIALLQAFFAMWVGGTLAIRKKASVIPPPAQKQQP